GRGDRPAGQETLGKGIGWSYELLDPAEQAIFARLGVFVGGCTLAAAEAVLADDKADGDELTAYIPASAILDGLTSLIDKSLLKEAEDVRGEPGFAMLEPIREYGLGRLAGGGQVDAVRRRD